MKRGRACAHNYLQACAEHCKKRRLYIEVRSQTFARQEGGCDEPACGSARTTPAPTASTKDLTTTKGESPETFGDSGVTCMHNMAVAGKPAQHLPGMGCVSGLLQYLAF